MINKKRQSFIRNTLRKASLRWPPRTIVKQAARTKRGYYMCAGYEREPHEVRARDVEVDHIKPVGEFTNWDKYINRLFCDVNNLQCLCKECHSIKTTKDR